MLQRGAIAAATYADIFLYEMSGTDTPEHFRLDWHHIVNGSRTMSSHIWTTARGSIDVTGMSTGVKGPPPADA